MSNIIKKARLKCIVWHADQKRKYTGEPYWHHPEAVAMLVKTVTHTDMMIAAAYMHDLLEDTMYTERQMRFDFGDGVTDLVKWLSDVSKPSDGNREARKAIDRAHIAAGPPAAKTIKLADLIDNSKSIIARDPDFARTYLKEKRLLLNEALAGGDPILWNIADAITRNAGY